MSFTCISCHVAFKEAQVQREHYKTDWHRYNLKRKVVDLPPVSAEAFQERVLEQRSQMADTAAGERSAYCRTCRKKFNSAKSYENHLQSRKHQEGLLKAPKGDDRERSGPVRDSADEDDEMEVEEVDSDEWEDDDEAVPVTDCLFCGTVSTDIEGNLRHMSDCHSFFIPDLEFVADVEGLLSYLGQRVGQGRLCMWCGHLGRRFPTTESVQKHMIDKGHCKMFHEGEVLLEYSDFYDYSSSYPDGGDPDEEVEVNVINDSGFELVLPSGATVGHRSLYRYYRQKLNPNPRPRPTKGAIQYGNYFKALGWNSGTSKEVVERKIRDMTFMRKVYAKNQLGVSTRKNLLQMKHFRRQVDF